MAGRIWIGPYKPLGVSTQAVPGGGYLNIDASVAQFGGSVLGSLGRQAAEGAAGIADAVSEHLANDNEAVVKAADVRLGDAEQTLLFDPQNGDLNTQGQVALTHAPAVIEAYTQAQDRELSQIADDDQRQMLQGLNERRLADFTTQVERHTAAERQRWYDEAGDRRIAQMQADARLHWSDDALLRRALGTTRFEVREKAKRKGWDTALTDAALREYTRRVLVSAIEGAVEHDPDRAQSVRTRYDQYIEAADRAALDALLTEAETRRRAEAATAEILNATPPDGEPSTPQWRLRQAEAIAEPAVRAATIRRVLSATAETQARARALAEQLLARVLKDGLTDSSQIPIREWANLNTRHRQAIETRLNHNAAGTEPAKNPVLIDELATEMTQAPHIFLRRDLVPAVAHLPLPQWQRFRDWQAGMRSNDPATEDEVYAIKRGLQLATKMPPADVADEEATNIRAGLIEDIATRRRVTGKSPGDTDIADMLARHVPAKPHTTHTLEWDPRDRPEIRLAQNNTKPSGPIRPRLPVRDSDRFPVEDRIVPVPILPPLGSVPGRPQPPAKPTPAPTTQPPSASGSPPAKPAPAPTSKPPSAPGSLPAKPAPAPKTTSPPRRGHHYIPQAVYNRLDLSEPARQVFARATTGPLTPGLHKWNKPHQIYSDVVAKVIDKWLRRKRIDPKKMTAEEAEQLLEYVKCHRHPVIGSYLRTIDDRHSEYCLNRRRKGKRFGRRLDQQ